MPLCEASTGSRKKKKEKKVQEARWIQRENQHAARHFYV
jgi:hypothetical protein